MSDQNDHKPIKIVEDGPKYRSVAMMSRQTVALQAPSIGEAQLKSAPYQLMNPALVTKQQPAMPTSWAVSSIIPVPSFHKLERTHITISGVKLDEVTRRIVDATTSLSIAAVYDDKQAKATLETAGCLKFDIRLWSGSNGQVIVECQRCVGCGYYFCQVAKKILKAAKTGVMKKAGHPGELEVPSSVRNAAPIECNDINKQVTDSMVLVSEMIKADRLDAHILALESMRHLTSSSSTKAISAINIMSGDVFDAIFSLIVSSRLSRSNAGDSLSSFEEEHFSILHRYAMQILSNCLVSLEETNELANVLTKRPELVSSELLNMFVVTVAGSASKPHEAVDACKCLQKLCQASEIAKKNVLMYSKMMNLENASSCRNALLKEESMKLMGELKL